jgi:hypothetical protein
MSVMLEAALRYAALGWFIFPLHSIRFDKKCGCGKPECTSPGKHPRIKWKEGATRDPVEVEKLWRKWPNAGIGLATGPSGLIVFDLDGPKGVEAFRTLLNPRGVGEVAGADNGTCHLSTARARTARGMHVFFRGQSPTFSNSESKLDVRSVGGYVVLAPSPHVSGHVYKWEVEPWPAETAGCGIDVIEPWNVSDPIAECPAPLLAYASAGGGKRRAAGGQGVGGMNGAPRGVPALSTTEDSFTTRLGASLEAPDWDEVDRALACIPADCSMDKWIKVGMALHAARDPGGWERWDRWSSAACARAAGKYKGKDEIAYKWTTFKHGAGRVGIGTLFAIAKESGWKRGGPESIANDINDLEANREETTAERPSDEKGGMNGHAPALPASFREASVVFPDLGEGGKRLKTCANGIVAVRALGIACERDRFSERKIVGGQVRNDWAGELSDDVVHVVRMMIRDRFKFDPGKQATDDALVQECLLHSFHPIRNYFESLQWDGVPRLDTWMIRYLGAKDDPFNRAVARLSLIAAVRRVLQPGCKFDHIIVLEGPEGRGKSSAIEVLAGSAHFSDQSILTLDDKAQQEAVAGVWLYEIADLAGHGKAEVEKVKAFASRTVDRARAAYARHRVDKPRTCIFFATTNDKNYLKSQTGNRRFWPVECGRVDLEGLRADRDQIWAEALAAERAGGPLVLSEKLWGAAREKQESRREQDPWEDALAGVERSKHCQIDNNEHRIRSYDLIDMELKIPLNQQAGWLPKRVATVMRNLGWDGPKPIKFKIDGIASVAKGYSKPVTGAVTATVTEKDQ